MTSFTVTRYFVRRSCWCSVTATSLGVVSSVPLTRVALSPARASRHAISMSLVSFAAVAIAAGVFALVGDDIVQPGWPAYEGSAGSGIGRLIVLLGEHGWPVVGVTITFPMIFVAGRGARLPVLAGISVCGSHRRGVLAVKAFELAGAALALTISTALVLVSLLLLLSPQVLRAGVPLDSSSELLRSVGSR